MCTEEREVRKAQSLVPGGTLRIFQEDLYGLWKIPRLFWAKTPSPPFPSIKALLTRPSFPGDRQCGSGFLSSSPLGPGFPSLVEHSLEPAGADWGRGKHGQLLTGDHCCKNTPTYPHYLSLLAFSPYIFHYWTYCVFH